MTSVPSNPSSVDACPNRARQFALTAFKSVLRSAVGDGAVTEVEFRTRFNAAIADMGADLYPNGWYDPPPSGVSVIFADEDNVERISFETLRKEMYWPKEKTTRWNDNLFFFYSSCVPRDGTEIGDFALTLYFGKDEAILRHYNNCFRATHEVMNNLRNVSSSKKIFDMSQEVFSRHRLQNTVVSYTDVTPLDLGHTFPALGKIKDSFKSDGILTPENCEAIRTARKFVNGLSDWTFEGVSYFSIEPQLRSIDDHRLPQITFHYMMACVDGKAVPCFDIDDVIVEYMSENLDVQGGRR